MMCTKCNAALEPGSRFCTECGTKQPQDLGSGTAALTPPVPPVPPPPAPPVPVPERMPTVPLEPSDFESAVSDVEVLGSAAPNEHYLGQRLQYREGAETFDAAEALHRATLSALRFHFFLALIIWGVSIVISLLLLLITHSRPLVLLLGLAVFAFNVALMIAPLVRRQNFPVSEWKLLIDDKAPTADDVYNHIAAALVARRSPVQYRALQLPDLWSRYLQVRMRSYSAFVTCFAFGNDLYIGWTLWWSMSWVAYRRATPGVGILAMMTLPWRIVVDMFTQRADSYELTYVHQFDEAKALRECVHAVTRQGVEAAIGVVPLRGEGTIGTTIPEGRAPTFATSPTFR